MTNNSSNWSTAYAEGENAQVVVKGDVTNEAYYRAVGAMEGGTVVIYGDATAGNTGACANDGNALIIGDVNAGNTGVISINEGTLEVHGDINAGNTGISTDGTSRTGVEGDVNYGTTGIKIEVKSESADVTPMNEPMILVLGTVKDDGTKENTTAITVNTNMTEEEAIEAALPAIYVYELEGDNLVTVNTDNAETNEAVVQYIKDNLNYIVKEDTSSKNYFSVIDRDSYLVPNINENFDVISVTIQQAIKVAVSEGYTISTGSNVEVVNNNDGTYTLKLIDEKGGFTISASLINVPSQAVSTTSSSSDSQESGDGTSQQTEEVAAPFIFATFTISGRNDLPSVLGATLEDSSDELVSFAPKSVVKVESGSLTAIQYKNAFINAVKNAPQGGIVRLETAQVSVFDKMMFEALASRPDVTLELSFPYAGENYETVVPAGADVMSVLDENGYCGFLKVLSVFGRK